jgi:hypothetical protein
MTTDPTTCPYCNAEVHLAAGLPAGHRITCPRCGEVFALREPTAAIQSHPGVTTTPPPGLAPVEIPPSPRQRWLQSAGANRRVARLVLLAMLLMAAIGLILALATVGFRRSNDKGLVKRPSRRPPLPPAEDDRARAPAVPPAQLAALGYLPPETNNVVGVHVQELLASQAGRDLLDTPFNVAGGELRLRRLKEWTGLSLDDVDHVVLGANLDDSFTPPVVLVARTVRPYDGAKVREALGAKKMPRGQGKKTLYTFQTKGAPFKPVLWFPDERTVVIGLWAESVSDIPAKPADDLEALAAPVRNVLRERVGPGGPLWIAGHIQDWKQGLTGLLAARLKADDFADLQRVRTFATWVQPDPAPTLGATAACVDEKAARRLEEKVLAGWQKDNPGLTFAREKEWLTLQWKTDPARLRRQFGK